MLVINERTTAPGSGQRVLDWMRTWTGRYGIAGLAIPWSGEPDGDRTGEAPRADLLTITPRAAVLIEVKEIAPEAETGVLSVRATGRWRLSGFDGDPIPARDPAISPFDQVMAGVSDLNELVRPHDADASFDGMVVVVPKKNSSITLNIESRRRGCAVVLGATSDDLRAWFHRTASRKLVWTAERVHALLADLDLADQVSVEELVREGFPAERTLAAATASAMGVARESRPVDRAGSAEISHVAAVVADSNVALSDSAFVQPSSALGQSGSAPSQPGSALAQPDSMPAPQPEATLVQSDSTPAQPDFTLVQSDSAPSAVFAAVPTDSDALPPEASLAQVPESTAPPIIASSSVESSENDDIPDDDGQAASAQARPVPPTAATHLLTGAIRSESSASEPVASGSTTRLGPEGQRREQSPPLSTPDQRLVDSVGSSEDAEAESAPESLRSEASPGAGFARARSAAPEYVAPEYTALEYAASESFAPVPFAPEPLASEPESSDLASTGPILDPAAQSASPQASSFTDQWSSWIEIDDSRPLRPHPTPSPQPNQLPWWSAAEPEQRRRPTAPAILERRPRMADLRRMIAVPTRAPSRPTGKPQPARHRPQQLAAVALIAFMIGAIWLLAAACSTPDGDAEQRPSPASATEVVAPAPTVTETPAQLNLLPLCLPFRSDC